MRWGKRYNENNKIFWVSDNKSTSYELLEDAQWERKKLSGKGWCSEGRGDVQWEGVMLSKNKWCSVGRDDPQRPVTVAWIVSPQIYMLKSSLLISECACIWRQGLQRANLSKMRPASQGPTLSYCMVSAVLLRHPQGLRSTVSCWCCLKAFGELDRSRCSNVWCLPFALVNLISSSWNHRLWQLGAYSCLG